MKYFSMLIKPASSICNLHCQYCFYHDLSHHRHTVSYGVMTRETVDSMLDAVFSAFDEASRIQFAFQGGEPTCAGLAYFQYFTAGVRQRKKPYHQVEYAIQTNGTLLGAAWISFLKENDFLIGISLDGYSENHDYFRGAKTHQLIMRNIAELRKAGIEPNILAVLTDRLAAEPEKLFQFLKTANFRYVQLIPCLPALDVKNNVEPLTPQRFANFYQRYFDQWYQAYRKGYYQSVTLFDNLVQMLRGFPPAQCGYLGYCSLQFVVEADGSVYPCDFYVLDDYRLGNIKTDSIMELAGKPGVQNFLHEKKRQCRLCTDCRYRQLCHGQCKRLNICYFDDTYCGLQAFLAAKIDLLYQIAQAQP
ncbi:Anaerobic sulfatase-maturating enzyme [bioreactor metagenome]|uniref:Anaerobic sulfatase-maturating enzyme n=1 Tax=bioreactor metagenome TaxID=1076179 RepID=A0A645CHG5_9ZZZZ|nr:SPASM domain-containing protein [Erysipelotrichaceae bacterium]